MTQLKKEVKKFLNKYRISIKRNRDLAILSSEYAETSQFYITIPCIFCISFSGFLSLISSSKLPFVNPTYISLVVGVLNLTISIIQSFASKLQFQQKSQSWKEIAQLYNKLLLGLRFVKWSAESEEKIIDDLKKKLNNIQNNQTFYFPLHIIDLYNKNVKNLNPNLDDSLDHSSISENIEIEMPEIKTDE